MSLPRDTATRFPRRWDTVVNRHRPDPVKSVRETGRSVRERFEEIATELEGPAFADAAMRVNSMKSVIATAVDEALAFDIGSDGVGAWNSAEVATGTILSCIRTPEIKALPQIERRMITLLTYAHSLLASLEYASINRPGDTAHRSRNPRRDGRTSAKT